MGRVGVEPTANGLKGVFTAEQARSEARIVLGQFARSINPNELEKAARARAITLAEVLEDFLQARKNLKPRTVADYRSVMSTYLVDWQNKPIIEITKDMVGKRHTAIATGLKITIQDRNGMPKEAHYCSESQANLAMRYLRALFNFAASQYEDGNGQSITPDNPVKRLSQTRAWYHIARRQTVIKVHELEAWFKAVTSLENDYTGRQREIVRDYLLLLMLTGLRREEAAKLTWKNVDLKAKTMMIPDTKNRQDHVLPLSDYLYELLIRRNAEAAVERLRPPIQKITDYIFKCAGIKPSAEVISLADRIA